MDYYRITPQIVPADQISDIAVTPRFRHAAFPAAQKIKLYLVPVSGILADGGAAASYWGNNPAWEVGNWQIDAEGVLRCRAFFAGEQEYVLFFVGENIPARGFSFYSLRPDYYALRPFKGDTHIHTIGSDGREAPAYVAARYRQRGFDFIAITDHRNYAPSLEAIAAFREFELDYQIFPGEEVHAPDNPVHIVNFAGDASVNELYRRDEAGYRREVERLLKNIPDRQPNVDYFPVAATEWVCDRIREVNGLAIFAHPYWRINQFWHSEVLTDAIFKERKFDALELIGGFHPHEYQANNFQAIRYGEELGRGHRPAIVGASDSHGTDSFMLRDKGALVPELCVGSVDAELFNWYYTIVLAEEPSRDALHSGIRNHRSVAVCAPRHERPEIFGPERLVRYASFLQRCYFPMHETLCANEGAAMLEVVGGDRARGAGILQLLKNTVTSYREDAFRRLP